MKQLTIDAYFDGRPGHEKQTLGILNALGGMTPIVFNSLKVSVSSSDYVKNWIAYLFSFLLPVRSVRKSFPVDLIIGTGSHTHLPMLLAKKSRYGGSGHKPRTVTCMTPDVLLRKEFDLCFIPMHDDPAMADNVFITLGPPNTVTFSHEHKQDRGLILLGGIDPKSHFWKSDVTVAQIRNIVDRTPTILWTISSSPRTPENTCASMAVLATANKNVSFFRASETPPGWIEIQYAMNRNVWVTADSVSMVYEALTAGCSVGVLPVEWVHHDNKFMKSLNFLARSEMIITYDAWQNGTPMPPPKEKVLNESERCAGEILKRWWPNRLG